MKTQISEKLIKLISTLVEARNDKGFETYKETLDDVPFENYDWEMMIIEELLDGLQYMFKENLRLKQELKEKRKMDFKLFQEMSKRTMPQTYNTTSERMTKSNYALGLNGESGELGEIIKKNVHHGHPISKENLKKEIGDVLHYLSGIATLYGISLEESATLNIVKLQKRYPKGFTQGDSIRRVDTKA